MEPKRNLIREPFNGVSHLLGAVLSIAGLIYLLILAQGRVLPTLAFSIYGISLIVLYTISALYHSLHISKAQEAWWQRCDYIAIYLLIAGTYTPVCLLCLPETMRRNMLLAVYGIAIVGISLTLLWKRKPHWIRLILYSNFPAVVNWMIAGGIVYTGGIVFYATERPKLWPGKVEGHEIWHLFVMGGSICHFIMMLVLLRTVPNV
jgi:hemolysin III